MSDWRDKSPGIERAKAVMRPMVPRSVGVAKYLRVSTYPDRPGDLYALVDTQPLVPAIEQEYGGVMLGFAPNDDHPRSRIISAERVEAAVETATVLDICADEGLHAAWWGDHWVVGDESITTSPAIGSAQTLRGAYVGYHEAQHIEAPSAGASSPCDECVHQNLSGNEEPCLTCIRDGWLGVWRPKP